MKKKKTPQTKQKVVSMKISNEISQGHYVNVASAVVTDSEVVVDFGYIFSSNENNQQGIIVSRIIMNHNMTTKLIKLVSETLKNHKEKNAKTPTK